jgi:hypothetical protein
MGQVKSLQLWELIRIIAGIIFNAAKKAVKSDGSVLQQEDNNNFVKPLNA